MNFRIPLLAIAALLLPASASAAGSFASDHPEEAYPNNMPRMTAPGPYDDLVKQVQEKLHAEGFDAGPVNGDFGTKTQAALAQYQLSQGLPASGALDEATLNELGVQADAQASVPDDESAEQDRTLGGTCDRLIGPDKEACLQQGGTLEVGVQPGNRAGTGASAR